MEKASVSFSAFYRPAAQELEVLPFGFTDRILNAGYSILPNFKGWYIKKYKWFDDMVSELESLGVLVRGENIKCCEF